MAQPKRRPLKDIAKPPSTGEAEAAAKRTLALKFDGFFLYALPGHWVVRAWAAGARARHVADLLWWVSGMNGHHLKGVVIRSDHREKWRLSRRVFEYGLADLERAGLVKVEREAGRPAKVTLIV
jgi:hypothetical protein